MSHSNNIKFPGAAKWEVGGGGMEWKLNKNVHGEEKTRKKIRKSRQKEFSDFPISLCCTRPRENENTEKKFHNNI